MIPLALVDHGTGQDPAYLAAVAEMLSVVSQRDFGRGYPRGWGVSCTARVAKSEQDAGPGEWVLGLFQTPDQPGALGYHDPGRQAPWGKVFPSLEQSHDDLAVTISHEVWEMLVDPECLRSIPGGDTRVRLVEVADPVEMTYAVYTSSRGADVRVSNWCLPAWYTGGPGPWDFLGRCSAPYQLLDGGYVSYFDGAQWSQETRGERRPYRQAVAGIGRAR